MKLNLRMETLITALALTLALGILASLEQSFQVGKGSSHTYRIAHAADVETPQRVATNPLSRIRNALSL